MKGKLSSNTRLLVLTKVPQVELVDNLSEVRGERLCVDSIVVDENMLTMESICQVSDGPGHVVGFRNRLGIHITVENARRDSCDKGQDALKVFQPRALEEVVEASLWAGLTAS